MRSGDNLWHKIFERDKGRCHYCEFDFLEKFEHYQFATIDHVKPRFMGGEDSEDNLVLCCAGCNQALSRSKLENVKDRKKHIEDRKSSTNGAYVKFQEYLKKKDFWK